MPFHSASLFCFLFIVPRQPRSTLFPYTTLFRSRKTHGGIILTDDVFQLFEAQNSKDLIDETEARWRLVETAWDMNLPKHLVQIQHDDQGLLVADNKIRRVNVTSAKSALNGYQKSRCFYCFAPITIDQ